MDHALQIDDLMSVVKEFFSIDEAMKVIPMVMNGEMPSYPFVQDTNGFNNFIETEEQEITKDIGEIGTEIKDELPKYNPKWKDQVSNVW
mmetsp:Transcript_32521/g.49743  ORF Transcript_32521/g.49743 Transcript_32521/m.49743 type:complete len:89 (-) Transcript_32521:731-997(-)